MSPQPSFDSGLLGDASPTLGARLGIAQKLFLMLLVPLLGLVAVASSQIAAKREVVSDMERLAELTQVGIAASQLAHQLQRERGRTVAYLGGADASSLGEQRERTDEALDLFGRAVQSAGLAGDVGHHADSALRALEALPGHRALVSERGVEVERGVQFYTDLIANLIGLVSKTVELADAPSASLSLVSLEALVRQKEAAGLERALGVAVLSGRPLGIEAEREFPRLLGTENALGDVFLAHAPSHVVIEYRDRLSGGFDSEVSRIRDLVLDRLAVRAAVRLGASAPMEDANAPLDSSVVEAWWTASTARIDAIYEVERLLEVSILDEVGRLGVAARNELSFFLALTIVCAIAAIALSYLVARGLVRSFKRASETLSRAVHEIGGFVRQQSAAIAETATAVAQTTTTVEELRRTADTASSRSQEMSGRADESRDASEQALVAIADGVQAMRRIRTEVEAIASSILDLSQKNLEIGEIVQSVGGIAEQSNLLAVNASIEAAKAGDHGRGFSVVANEVKGLAEQSKQATRQIRLLLQTVQKSSNGAVMTTEQGVKRVEEGSNLIEALGRSIESLRSVVEASAESASQISLISSQQLAGIAQITEAMRNIGVASMENAQGAKQLESAAAEIERVSLGILALADGRTAHKFTPTPARAAG